MKYGWLMCAAWMGMMACGDPEVNIIYKEGKAPVVMSGGGMVPVTRADAGMVPTPTGAWPPSSPTALGPTTPVSTTPCMLDERRSIQVDTGAGVFFADGVLRCTAPVDSTDVSVNWGHPSTSSIQIRVGGDGGTWMSETGFLNEEPMSRSYFADRVPVQGGGLVDFYIEDSAMLNELYIGFDDPSLNEEGG